MTEPRVVSLLPSATEIVAALGFETALVGRSHECDFPPGVEQLPVCTEPKVDPRGSTEEIHRRVEALLAESLSVYRVHVPRLKELSPTHVITQVQCEVCAVSLDDLEEALSGWTGTRPALVALNPSHLANVFDDMQRVAAALGVPREGERLVEHLRRRMGAIEEAVRATDARPRVATIEWLSPLMAAGNWMPELVAAAGGTNLFGEARRHSSWLKPEELSVADPDVILVFPCGFSLTQLEREIGLLTSLPGWNALTAVRAGRVYLAEGNQYFNRPGPRLAETLEIVAEILHPDLFSFGHEGIAWRRLG